VPLPKFAFFRGRIVPYGEAKFGVLNHTFNYGTGIFGGIRAYWNDEERELFIFRRSTTSSDFSSRRVCCL